MKKLGVGLHRQRYYRVSLLEAESPALPDKIKVVRIPRWKYMQYKPVPDKWDGQNAVDEYFRRQDENVNKRKKAMKRIAVKDGKAQKIGWWRRLWNWMRGIKCI